MSVDVTGLKASAEHVKATIHALVELVEKALASNSDAADAAVQAELDAIKAGLDGATKEGDDEVAKAAPAPVVEPAPAPVEPPAEPAAG